MQGRAHVLPVVSRGIGEIGDGSEIALTRRGIPNNRFDYRLGNRSTLDWAIGQYQITGHKRGGIKRDPNRKDDPEYIVRLVGQVIRVSLETVRIVENLPAEYC